MSAGRERAKAYQRYRVGLYLAGLIVSAIFLCAFQFSGLSLAVAAYAGSLAGNFYFSLAVYFTLFSIAYYLVTVPLDLFGGFVVEHRFGLSNQTFGRWCADEAKRSLLSFCLSLLMVETFYLIGRNVPGWWWLIAAVIWLFFSIGLARIFPLVILPLFYTYLPLRSEDLRKRVVDLARAFDIRLEAVNEIDFSKNTRKSNAAVIGWGKSRRVILADNLVSDFTPDEVSVVVAHEMAHYRLAHIRSLMLVNAASTLVFFLLLSRVLGPLSLRVGAAGPFDIAAFPLVALLFGAYGAVVTPALYAYSRKLEREADRVALEVTGTPGAFMSLMRRLAEKNLSDEDPPVILEYLFYNHPPIAKRIRMAEYFAKRGKEGGAA